MMATRTGRFGRGVGSSNVGRSDRGCAAFQPATHPAWLHRKSTLFSMRGVLPSKGHYECVDSGDRFQGKRLTVNPPAALSLQMHYHRAEHWVVVKGTARITAGEKVSLLSEDQSTYIPWGTEHRLENPGKIPLELIEVQTGSIWEKMTSSASKTTTGVLSLGHAGVPAMLLWIPGTSCSMPHALCCFLASNLQRAEDPSFYAFCLGPCAKHFMRSLRSLFSRSPWCLWPPSPSPLPPSQPSARSQGQQSKSLSPVLYLHN
jgi:mannose-6-phosphate isomerase-like protein (cupin superfamily)